MSNPWATKKEWETVANQSFLENKGHGFDGCDTVRLYDYLIYYEECAIRKNIDEEKRISWFVKYMKYGVYVYDRLKDDQKRTWAEFKQNLLEAYKKEEQVRMSWSVPRYSQQKRVVQPIKFENINDTNLKSETKVEHAKSEDFNETAPKSKPPDQLSTKFVSHDRFRNEEPKRSGNRRRCFNCGSATHLLKNCRVPPASVRRTNNHREKIEFNHQQRNRSGDQNSYKPLVNENFQSQQSEQNRIPTANEIYVEANVGQNKTSLCAILDTGSNCNVMNRRFYTTNIGNLPVLRRKDESVTSFNGACSVVIGSVETNMTFDGTSLSVPFKVIDNINYDAMLGLEFIKTNVEWINIKERKLTLSCGTEVSFREHDFYSLDGSFPLDSGSLVVGALRVEKRRPSFARSSRRFPPSWRDPPHFINCY